jgi:predicted AAA+ superfamily ATPase
VILRNVTEALLTALADRPAVLLHGARQTGKSTLVAFLAADEFHARSLSFEDPEILAAARPDPGGFLESLAGPVVLDEVQRIPELLPSVRALVHRDRRPGRFLLIASSNLADTLGGHLEAVTLWPFSQGEIEEVHEGFVDALFSERLPSLTRPEEAWPRVVERIARGGYPDVVAHETDVHRRAWFGAYVTSLLQRDTAPGDGRATLPHLLSLLASRGASRPNHAELARAVGISATALRRHLTFLESSFAVQALAPWRSRAGRPVGMPKLHLTDTGLLTYLLVTPIDRLAAEPTVARPTLEVFVVTELRKQLAWSATRADLFYFRTPRAEVDAVLEERGGRVVGIALTTNSTVGPADFSSLRLLAQSAGPRFHRGVLLYAGVEIIPFGPKLHALPVSALWQLGATPHQAPA